MMSLLSYCAWNGPVSRVPRIKQYRAPTTSTWPRLSESRSGSRRGTLQACHATATQSTTPSSLPTLTDGRSVSCGVTRLWSQGGHKGSGNGSPPAGSRGRALVRIWGWRTQKPDIKTICSCQILFYAGFFAESVLHLPLPPPKNFGSARIPWPNTAHPAACPPVPNLHVARVGAN